MNQQEIKENMTQGTWSVNPIYDIVTNEVENRCDCGYSSIVAKKENSLAITHAINNTYGKGINPESVSEMYNALTIVAKDLTELKLYDAANTIQSILKKAAL